MANFTTKPAPTTARPDVVPSPMKSKRIIGYIDFEVCEWNELKVGDKVYCANRGDFAHGPFVVVDPKIGRLQNGQGVEFNFPTMKPMKIKC